MTRDEQEAAYQKLHDLLIAQFQDQLLDAGFDPDLVTGIMDAGDSVRLQCPSLWDRSEPYRRALDAGIAEPTWVVVPPGDSRAETLRFDLERSVNETDELAPALLWSPTGRVLQVQSSVNSATPEWWMSREDAERLINVEILYRPATLPRLPDGLFWRVNWTCCLWIIEPFAIDEAHQQVLAPPTKYVPFAYG